VKMIVGIEIPMLKLEGKWKMSQNRAMPDRLGTVAGLRARGDEAVAAVVEHYATKAS
jgi:transcriptional regulator